MNVTSVETSTGDAGRRVEKEGLRVDHAFLRQILLWLESAKEPDALAQLLDDFDEYLVAHFRAEEAEGGFFDVVVERAPQRAATAQAIRGEHGALLLAVKELRARVGDGLIPVAPAIAAGVAALTAAVRAHEAAEERLLAAVLENGNEQVAMCEASRSAAGSNGCGSSRR
jgi:hemerythrin HHE cation binding domain-containing protein